MSRLKTLIAILLGEVCACFLVQFSGVLHVFY
jgi:hypothetical protein